MSRDFLARDLMRLLPTEQDPYVVFLTDRMFVVWVAAIGGHLRWQLASQMPDGPTRFNGDLYAGEITAPAIEAMVAEWWTRRRALKLAADQ